jgi:2Fe-2S ferredoxin
LFFLAVALAQHTISMLDLAFDLQETSRLGCQLIMTYALDGLVVSVPERQG